MVGAQGYSAIRGANVVIVTAGVPRKPGMSRDDLVGINTKVIMAVADGIRKYCPKAFVICVTNPLDAMVWTLRQASGLPPNMVVGMAGVLDSAASAISSPTSSRSRSRCHRVRHGWPRRHHRCRWCAIPPSPASRSADMIKMGWTTRRRITDIVQRTRDGGAEIVGLLKTGSAFYAPASAAIQMAEAYIKDKKRILPCAAHLTGQYGVRDLYLGVPVVIGAGGVERIVEVDLNAGERKMLQNSIEAVRDLVNTVKKMEPSLARKGSRELVRSTRPRRASTATRRRARR